MQSIYDVIIIGGGPAGYSAALYTARAGLSTLVVERMSPGGQMTLTGDIENYPGFDEGVDGFSLGMKMQAGAEKFGAVTEYAEVMDTCFDADNKKITTTSGDYFAKTVIIATGANPRELGIDNEAELTGQGVHYCAHCDGRFYKDKIVAVVGGGNSAVADALYLSRLAKKVYLIHRRDTLRATKIYHEPLMKADNVEFVWDSTIERFVADGSFGGVVVRNVKTNNLDNIDCDACFVSIGRKPATEFLQGKVSLDENGYIIAGEDCKTNLSGVFAVGDVRTKVLRQVVTAAADGAIAAHYAEEYINKI